MLGSMSEGQLQTVQQHMQDRFVTMQQRRGVPEVFGDGLGRAADSSFVTPQPFDVLPGFGVQQSNHGNSQQLDVFAKSEKWLTPAPTPVGTWKTREEEVLGLCMSMSLLTWKPKIGLWLIAKTLKVN